MRSPPLRTAGLGLLVLSGLLVVGFSGWTFWICNLATYHCPETGCGDAPARNCAIAWTELPFLVAGGVLVLLLGLGLLLSENRIRRATATGGTL